MKDWTWPATVIFGLIIGAIVVSFVLNEDAVTAKQLIGYLEIIVGPVVGAVMGGSRGGNRKDPRSRTLLLR